MSSNNSIVSEEIRRKMQSDTFEKKSYDTTSRYPRPQADTKNGQAHPKPTPNKQK